ncbi:MAG: hypothetical protein JNL89_12075 [Rhodanobacteraceae bacterium]|jgi:hypothetical protein|nr:hypothetical protein [Rhodanobacteraceae bacterium]
MKRSLLSLSLMLASLCAAQPLLAQEAPLPASSASAAAAPDPALHIREAARLLRGNDLAGLVRAMMPAAKFQELREAYELARAEPTTDEQRAEFAEKIGRLTAPNAVDVLMTEIEPKLEEARPQAAGAIMMGIGAAQMALASPDAELTEEQRATLRAALPGIQEWVTTTDFLSSDTARQALTLIADAARATGVSNLDQLKMLSFEEVLGKAGNLLAASKRAIRLYGLDVDAILASTQVEVLEIAGTTARVRTTVTVFDAPLSKEIELVLIDGRWYGKDAADKVHFHIGSSES